MRPATSPEGRENQLIALATDLAESRLRDGTASAQEITHFLKMGSPREQMERLKMDYESKLLEARAENITSMGRMEELTDKALRAFRQYAGQPDEDDDDD
jgi:hypothetical protein